MTNERGTVVVTGGTGFLGRAVVEQFRAVPDAEVVALGSSPYDLRSLDASHRMVAELRPSLVLHLAAVVGGIGANRQRPAELYHDNLVMGVNIIDACRLGGVEKLAMVGTVCSYPKFTPVPFEEDKLWTGYPEETNAPYGLAKLSHLVHLQANHAQYGQRSAYLLPTNLYGPGDNFDPASSHVIPALIRKCLTAIDEGVDEIEVWGTGAASREFMYVDDAARAIVALTRTLDTPEPVNVGVGEETSIKALAELIAEATGFTGAFRWNSDYPDGQPRRCLDTSRMRAAIGELPTTDLRDGLGRTVEWYRARQAATVT